jgi:hypothetical protein
MALTVAFVAVIAVFAVGFDVAVRFFSAAVPGLSRRDIVDAVGVVFLALGWLAGYAGYRSRPRLFWLDVFLVSATVALLASLGGIISARLVPDAERALDMLTGAAGIVVLTWFLALTGKAAGRHREQGKRRTRSDVTP